MRQFKYAVFIFFSELLAVDIPCLTSLPCYTPKDGWIWREEEKIPRIPPLQGRCPHSSMCHGRADVEPTLTSLVNCGLTNSPSTLGVSVLGATQDAPFLGA